MSKLLKIIFWGLVGVILMPVAVFAHVGYVVPKQEISQKVGADFNFLLSALRDPLNIGLIATAIVAVAIIYFIIRRNSLFMNRVAFLRDKMASYLELTP